MDTLELILLFDYYGDLLTQRQRQCFDLHYNQDLSLGEIAQELSISRQAVFDNLGRTEALLKNMEEKTGCVRRDRQSRRVMASVSELAGQLLDHPDAHVGDVARQIRELTVNFEE